MGRTNEELETIVDTLQNTCQSYEDRIRELDQLPEKVKTLTEQKHGLEQTNIGLQKENDRQRGEIATWKQNTAQIKDMFEEQCIVTEKAENELKTMMDRLHRFMDKYI